MGGMREIVNLDALSRWFAVLAVVLPLVGLALGAGWGRRQGNMRRGAITGVGIGALGTLNWLLWLAYNAITSRLGLDTTHNVIVNLTFFVLMGLALGVGVGLVQRRNPPETSDATPTSNATTEQEPEALGEIL